MKQFLTKTIYLSLPIVLAAILMETLLRCTPSDYTHKKAYLDQHASEIETLILGSSHAFYGIDPAYFKTKAFNASHISQPLNYDFELLKKYQKSFSSLKTVVLPISYFSFFTQLETSDEAWRVKNYIIYYGMDTSDKLSDYTEVFSNRTDVNIKRLIKYYLLGRPAISCTHLGWGTSFNSKNAQDLYATGKIAAQRHSRDDIHSVKYQNIFKHNLQTINQMVEWCNERDIHLLLFTPPAYETYRQNLNQEQLNTTLEYAKQMALTSANCSYINLLEDSRFVTNDFYDADHLSKTAALSPMTFMMQTIYRRLGLKSYHS